MKIAIATPFYEVKGYSPYIISLMNTVKGLNELQMEYDYYELSGDSYVDRAKNTIAHRFMESDFTHLFMVDSDLGWDVMGFMRIVKAAKLGFDCVGGAFPNKNNWQSYGVILMHDKEGFPVGYQQNGTRLLDCIAIPGGFIMYSKKAFKSVQPAIKKYKSIQGDQDSIDHYEYFACDTVEKGRMGEDVYFQNKLRQAGGKVMLEPNVHFVHYGVKGWAGNFHEHLQSSKVVHGKGGQI
tara:strand:- start:4862 stop:5575 length:714 start_codon:yes stop_codon:yes gene_type:complete